MTVDLPSLDEIMKDIPQPAAPAADTPPPGVDQAPAGLKPIITYGDEWKNRKDLP